MDGITIEKLDPAEIELVAPLWRSLLDHVAVLPDAVVPIRPFEQSWPLERKVMLDALEGDAFVMVARRDGEVIGYCFVVIESADPVWYTGDQYAEIAHLSVAEVERGRGVGSAMLDAIDELLEDRGIVDVQIGVDQANDEALGFYERRGFKSDYRVIYGSPGRKEWACLAREKADREAGRGRFAAPGPAAPDPTTPGPRSPGRTAS